MTAHVTFAHGGLILPALTPYDRQLLGEYVLHRFRDKERLRIAVDGKTWMIKRPGEHRHLGCEACKRQLTLAALHTLDSDATFCVTCALC